MTGPDSGGADADRLLETVLAALPEAGAAPGRFVTNLATRLPEARALSMIRALLTAEASILATFRGRGPNGAATAREAALDLAVRADRAEASGVSLPVRMRDLPD
jgi:hypothetical protein